MTRPPRTALERVIRIALILLLLPPFLAGLAGWLVAPNFIHPIRRALTPDLIQQADATFKQINADSSDFSLRAPDGVMLHGWKVVRGQNADNWVILFHGVADNRMGVLEHARIFLLAGYGVIMMDARAIVDALISSELQSGINVQMRMPLNIPGMPAPAPRTFHIFALGESMGAGIALQSAAADPRIDAVVAESSFADLREASYDYAGLRKYPWLGKTLFAPFSWMLLYRGEKLAGLPVAEVSTVKAVSSRPFPVLLICDEKDEALPCRHSEMIYAAARGPKQLWVVPGAFHTAALGFQPEEFRRRVLSFFSTYATSPAPSTTPHPAQ